MTSINIETILGAVDFATDDARKRVWDAVTRRIAEDEARLEFSVLSDDDLDMLAAAGDTSTIFEQTLPLNNPPH